MRKILLRVAYDGGAYAGWQSQTNARAIQDVFEEALAEILGERARVRAASRTDAGVHAADQAVHFTTTRPFNPKALVRGVTRHLPGDIAVLDAREVPLGFDACRDAVLKRYRYRLLTSPQRDPLRRDRVWWMRHSLDLARMETAAEALVGEHDFLAFQGPKSDTTTTVREMYAAWWERVGDELQFVIEGRAFLRYMVRSIVGTLVDIGRGRRPVEHLAALLARPDRALVGPTAPARALCLERVVYRGESGDG